MTDKPAKPAKPAKRGPKPRRGINSYEWFSYAEIKPVLERIYTAEAFEKQGRMWIVEWFDEVPVCYYR